jgi:hypothetical protein
MFLILMVIGLVGLAMMALPVFTHHGAAGPSHGHGDFSAPAATSHLPAHAAHAPAHVPAAAQGDASVQGDASAQGNAAAHPSTPGPAPAHAHAHAYAHGAREHNVPGAVAPRSGLARWIPSPRGVFTALALFGAFGNLFVDAVHLAPLLAALAAVVPTLLVERFAVRPLWNLVFRYQGQPSASLEHLIMNEAVAVVPFRNGRGIVSTNREGRIVQLRACLPPGEALQEVKVGDRLRIEDVDAANERVTVSVLRGE